MANKKQEGVPISKEQVAALQHLKYPSHWPDLAPADFSPFRKVKEGLAGLSFNGDSLKKAWEGVNRIIALEQLATTFISWSDGCKNCMISMMTRLKNNFK